jgi:hypothetical protein
MPPRTCDPLRAAETSSRAGGLWASDGQGVGAGIRTRMHFLPLRPGHWPGMDGGVLHWRHPSGRPGCGGAVATP